MGQYDVAAVEDGRRAMLRRRRRRQHRPRRQPQEQPRHQVRLLLHQRHRLPYYQAESICTKCCWEDSRGTTRSNLPDILVRVISSSTEVKKDTDINT
uniref:Uncharacterized protein n=1 Tax=Oryza glumipatula TaxID=40148 RepID=A0A0E0AS18_9ORYZ